MTAAKFAKTVRCGKFYERLRRTGCRKIVAIGICRFLSLR